MSRRTYTDEMIPKSSNYTIFDIKQDDIKEYDPLLLFTSSLKSLRRESLKTSDSIQIQEDDSLSTSSLNSKNFIRAGCSQENLQNITLKTKLLNELENLFQQCKKDDWDGYGASGVSKLSLEVTKNLINLLPEDENIAVPELDPLPTGEIALCWNIPSNMSLSLTFSDNKILSIFIERDEKNTKTSINKYSEVNRLSDEIKQILRKNFTKSINET